MVASPKEDKLMPAEKQGKQQKYYRTQKPLSQNTHIPDLLIVQVHASQPSQRQ